MRNFLYLRIASLAGIVIIITVIVAYFFRSWNVLLTSKWYVAPANMLLYGLFAIHSLMIVYVHNRYYPAGTIPKPKLVIFRISDVISIILFLACVAIVMLNIFFPDYSGSKNYPEIRYREIGLCSTLAVILIIQVVGGERMVKTIRANARKQLEDSFA